MHLFRIHGSFSAKEPETQFSGPGFKSIGSTVSGIMQIVKLQKIKDS
jgi:hypothetical protein